MAFRIVALPHEPFAHLYGKSDDELQALGARAYVAGSDFGFPCRVSLEDASAGERMILVGYEHLSLDTPYRSRHAVFVRDGAQEVRPIVDRVPDYLGRRLLSVRAFDTEGMMTDADICAGTEAGPLFDRMLADGRAAYLHVHTARRGCYLARVERA